MLGSSPSRRLSNANLNIAGIKRRAPSLLPAFEPSSSPPPRFKRQKSRPSVAEESENQYPENHPVTLSLGPAVLPSSPPPQLPSRRAPLLQRNSSTVSERVPLSAVPSITLPADGEPVLLGRSSKSSHYGLSANRLISRVHIKAFYMHATTPGSRPKIELHCLGWNGVKIHCQGNAWELAKGDVFTTESEHSEIMLDVQDSRVVLAWPGNAPEREVDVPGSSPVPVGRVRRSPSYDWGSANDENINRAIAARKRLTPVSPTPRRNVSENSLILPSESMISTDTLLDIYEDEPAIFNDEDDELPLPSIVEEEPVSKSMSASVIDEIEDVCLPSFKDSGFASDLVLPPVGTFSTAESLRNTPCPTTPSRRQRSSAVLVSSPLSTHSSRSSRRSTHSNSNHTHRSPSISPNKYNTLQNHLTNQLAFSRVATVPLTELFENLPMKFSGRVTKERLGDILKEVDCIGEVKRYGKDAAGKPLESQFYYLADKDQDERRRQAVGGRAGVRSCRKQHKQYYWKKPKARTY